MSRFRNWLLRGMTAGDLILLLRNEGKNHAAGPDYQPGPLTNAEESVRVTIRDALSVRDRRARRVTRRQIALTNSAHRSKKADDRLSLAQAEPAWANAVRAEYGPDGPAGGDRQAPAGHEFREMFDPHRPLIHERVLLVIEVVFVLVEFAFWYGIFTENVQAHAPLLDPTRVSDILLAIMIPLSGIVAARVVGSLAHRVVSRYPQIGRKEYLGTPIAAAVAIMAVIGIFFLVYDRFASAGHTVSSLGALPVPALAMTLIFVVVLVGDMVARIFLVSEIRAQTDKRLRDFRKLRTRVIRANRRHVKAWLRLRTAVQVQLDHCERIVAAGGRIITDQRSFAGAPVPPPDNESRPAHHDGTATAAMTVPAVSPLRLYGASMAPGPLHVIEGAISTLREFQPRSQQGLGGYLDGMTERLCRLSPAEPAEPGSAGRTGRPQDPESPPSWVRPDGPRQAASQPLTGPAGLTPHSNGDQPPSVTDELEEDVP